MTAPRIAPLLLREAGRAVEELLGIALAGPLARRVEDAVVRSAAELGLPPEALVSRLADRDPACAAAVVERTVVRETYFGRYPEQLAAILRHVVSPAPAERPLRIWSAGCATGEEAYELAMALVAAGRREGLDRIVATDASEHALEQARAAEYGARSVRRLEPAWRERYLAARGALHAVAPGIRGMVELRRSNLMREVPPGGPFDLVLCRSVLIYFTPRAAVAAVRRLAVAVRPGGFLALGPAEAPLAAELSLEWTGEASLLRSPTPRCPAPARAPAPTAARAPARLSPERPRGCRPERALPARTARPPGPPAAPRRAAEPAATGGAGADGAGARVGPPAGSAESYLLLAMAAEAGGDLEAALGHLRRALYLDPRLALAHASLAALHRRMGRPEQARRAGLNAFRALEGVEDGTVVPGVGRLTAGALREALQHGGLVG